MAGIEKNSGIILPQREKPNKKNPMREFPDGPVIRTRSFHHWAGVLTWAEDLRSLSQ